MSKPERHSLRTVASAISRMADFTCNDTLTGEWSWNVRSLGQLPLEYRGALVRETQELDEALYIVYSYATPIAWYNPRTSTWTRPDVKYSVTTSRHQGKCPVDGTTV